MKENRENMVSFKEAFDTMAGILHKKILSREELRKTWDLLKNFSFNQITQAIDEWLLKDNNFMPAPGELATIIKYSKDQATGELKSITELQDIKNKFGTIDNNNITESECFRCRGTGFVILQQKNAPYYTQAFACDCYKSIWKIKVMETYIEGLNKGFEFM